MLKVNKPRAGFYLLILALICTFVGFSLYFGAFDALTYKNDRWVIALTVMAFWSIAFLLVNALFAGDKPFWTSIFYIIIIFALMFAFARFLSACLSPIGIYFTVTMGDMEAYALGVPRCIVGVVFYFLATVFTIVASFCRSVKIKGEESAFKLIFSCIATFFKNKKEGGTKK